jgi:hypothetical protein
MASEPAWWTQQKSNCGLPSSLDYNTWVAQGSPCGNTSGGNGSGNSTDYWQEQERQRAAEQARQEQLKREEEERARQAEETRRLREKQQHDAFIKERDSTVLKGDTGTPVFGIGGLKGVGSTDSGLKGISAAEPAKELRDLSGPQAAWKQLNCAAAIAGNAIAALQSAIDGKTGERDEFKYLSSESSRALAGEQLGVVCPAPPPLPSRSGQRVDVDKGKVALQRIMDRAAKVAERLPSERTSAPSAGTQPGTSGDDLSKLRDTQLALNRINERKYDPPSQDAINRENKAKQEATALLLAAQKVESGNFSVDLTEISGTRPTSPKKPQEARPNKAEQQ